MHRNILGVQMYIYLLFVSIYRVSFEESCVFYIKVISPCILSDECFNSLLGGPLHWSVPLVHRRRTANAKV